MKETANLLLENKMEELDRIVAWIDQIAEQWCFKPMIVFNLNLVLEEAFSNIVNYAYSDQNRHQIELVLEQNDNDVLTVKIIDDGTPYDPTQNEDPDTTLSAEERAIGGLGIFFIKQMMDTVDYERVENKNKLSLTKKL